MIVSVGSQLLWGSFLALVAGCLAIDLCAHRRPRELVLRDALRWTVAWLGLAAAGAAAVWLLLGGGAFLQFAAAYAVEWSLSVDNVLVFAAVLAGLAVPARRRYAVLFYGSLGAIALRTAFILAGSALLGRFGWLTCAFGALLLATAVRVLREPAGRDEPAAGAPPRLPGLLRRLPAPPLVLAALAVAVTDLAFATDSVPAVFGMTRDPFIAFASNALAVIGLRSLYFVLETAVRRFRCLKPALVALLVFVGAKMLVDPLVPGGVPPALSLTVIAAILAAAVLAGWLRPGCGRRTGDRQDQPEPARSIASNL